MGMGKIKLPKSLLRLLFPKKRRSSTNNDNKADDGRSVHVGVGGSSQNNNSNNSSTNKPSSRENNYYCLDPQLHSSDNAIAVIENYSNDDDDDNDTNYTTEAEESILSTSSSSSLLLLPSISLEEMFYGATTTTTITHNNIYHEQQHDSDDDDDDDEEEDFLLRPLETKADPTTHQAAVDSSDTRPHVVTPPSSPGIDIHHCNRNNADNNMDEQSSVVETNNLTATTTTTLLQSSEGTTTLLKHNNQDMAKPTPSTTTTSEATTIIMAKGEAAIPANQINTNHHQVVLQQTATRKKPPSSSRVQFSLHGEEARQRAVARQRKILSRAHLRLDSISETSLEHIKEVTSTTATSGIIATTNNTTSTTSCEIEEADDEAWILLGDATKSSTKQERHHHQRRQFKNDDDDEGAAAAASSSASVASSSIASSSYSWGRGNKRGNVSSYIFYESPTSPQNKSSSSSSSSSSSPLETNDDVAVTTHGVEEKKDDRLVRREGDAVESASCTTTTIAATNIDDHSAAAITTTKRTDDALGTNNATDMQFFILLLCPTSRIFELLQINDYANNNNNTTTTTLDETAAAVTIQDILSNVIPKHCTDDRLKLQKYVGLVRAEDRNEFVELDAKAFFVEPSTSSSLSPSFREKGTDQDVTNDDGVTSTSARDETSTGIQQQRRQRQQPNSRFIQRHDLLVAILEGYTGYQMAKISKPILRNSKFCEMIRRRSGVALEGSGSNGGGGGGSIKEDAVVGGGKNNASMAHSGVNQSLSLSSHEGATGGGGRYAVGVGTSESKPSSSPRSRRGKKGDTKARSAASAVFKDDAYLSLCNQLKQLSKKLHIVDDEIARENSIALPASPARKCAVAGGGTNIPTATTPTNENSFAKFKMTPKMVALELAMNIEDIFANHDVEIVAVDADDDDETTVAGVDGETIDADVEFDDRTDDDTFVSARSMRSLRSSRSMRSMLRKNEHCSVIVADDDDDENGDNIKPVMEITTKRKERKGRMARGNKSMFDNYEEDDMMLQIEAMARQAESEFENRKKGAVVKDTKKNEGRMIEVDWKTDSKATGEIETQETDAVLDEEIDDIPSITGDYDDVKNIVTSSPIPTRKSLNSQTERDTLARSFLNASTNMVSTMVAASQGRVNEVHVLQYLGVTIVCIAANFMQQARSASSGGGPMSPGGMAGGVGGGGGSGFGARDVLQSAMFLAFMVNGQRYMAKVTKK